MENMGYAPQGYQTVTPHFTVENADKMIQFMSEVFGADILNRSVNENDLVIHAEVRIGNTVVEVSDGNEAYPPRQNTLHVFVGDPDRCYQRALNEGAISLFEPADMPYGERSGGVRDPFGNHWYIARFTGEAGHGYYG
ncbi:VOC family protein [Pseudalkalibacillus salsuginis]|uniref:VOC family protein n=1 Tax=Pseudalkalibacillus salsuginis TaxID=2910972 RepID=UPI001F452BA0|nr:VOC family protein [Pseudalkalibacillus salsuginis]MCF6409670.1 VOC family protein [Pseudalkalibacillus salsuginis]